MRWGTLVFGLALAAAASSAASAGSVFVSAFDGPWSIASNPSLDYGIHDNMAPVVLTLASGVTSITLTYESGLASAFGGSPPSVDPYGYVGGVFGSGVGYSGIGSSGTPFPTFFVDPKNTGSPLYLMALVGAFTNNAGVVQGSPFACDGSVRTCDGSVLIAVPAGATRLSLGVNDDIFFDNSGGWNVSVTGVVPEPSTWAMMLLGFAGLGFAGYRKARMLAM
jgi:hypothetical protein